MSGTSFKTGIYMRVMIPNAMHDWIEAYGEEHGLTPELALREIALLAMPPEVAARIPAKFMRTRLTQAPAEAPPQPLPMIGHRPLQAFTNPAAEVRRLSKTGMKSTAIAAKLRMSYREVERALKEAGNNV